MGGLIQSSIQPNMQRLMDDVREGSLDFVLTKPAEAQLIVSVREFRLWQLVDAILGLVILGIAMFQLHETLGLWEILAFSATLLMGRLMIYSFWLMLSATTFCIIRAHEMVNLFQGVYAAGRCRWVFTRIGCE